MKHKKDCCSICHVTGFTKYLLSEECDIFEPLHKEVCQNMRHPLTHYFISSSHNTYLLEDQLKGPSSVEGYIRALGNGCRCIKGEKNVKYSFTSKNRACILNIPLHIKEKTKVVPGYAIKSYREVEA